MLKNLHRLSVITAYSVVLLMATWSVWWGVQGGGDLLLALTDNGVRLFLAATGLLLFAFAPKFSFWFNLLCLTLWTASMLAIVYWQLSSGHGLFMVYPWAEYLAFGACVVGLATLFFSPCRALYKPA